MGSRNCCKITKVFSWKIGYFSSMFQTSDFVLCLRILLTKFLIVMKTSNHKPLEGYCCSSRLVCSDCPCAHPGTSRTRRVAANKRPTTDRTLLSVSLPLLRAHRKPPFRFLPCTVDSALLVMPRDLFLAQQSSKLNLVKIDRESMLGNGNSSEHAIQSDSQTQLTHFDTVAERKFKTFVVCGVRETRSATHLEPSAHQAVLAAHANGNLNLNAFTVSCAQTQTVC